jgi:hypothetical protein
MSEVITQPLEKGQRDAAHSIPVVLASDQPALPITITGGATEVTLDDIKTLIETRVSGNFVPGAYDYMSFTPNATDDVYVFKLGGAGGTTTKTLTITYTGVDKLTIANIAAV